MMKRNLFALAVLGVAACSGPGNDNNPNDGDVKDPDNTESGTATLTAEVYTLNVETDCQVNIDGEFAGFAWEQIEVSTGSHDVTIGDLGTPTLDDLPIHVVDGLDWVSPTQQIDPSKGDSLNLGVDLGRWFALDLRCSVLECVYDSSADNGFGDLCNPVYDWGEKFVEVVNGHEVYFDSDNFENFGSFGKLEVVGDALAFNGVSDVRLERSSIGDDNSITFALVEDEEDITEFTCIP